MNRFGQSEERLLGKPDVEMRSLVQLPDLISIEVFLPPPSEFVGIG